MAGRNACPTKVRLGALTRSAGYSLRAPSLLRGPRRNLRSVQISLPCVWGEFPPCGRTTSAHRYRRMSRPFCSPPRRISRGFLATSSQAPPTGPVTNSSFARFSWRLSHSRLAAERASAAAERRPSGRQECLRHRCCGARLVGQTFVSAKPQRGYLADGRHRCDMRLLTNRAVMGRHGEKTLLKKRFLPAVHSKHGHQ